MAESIFCEQKGVIQCAEGQKGLTAQAAEQRVANYMNDVSSWYV